MMPPPFIQATSCAEVLQQLHSSFFKAFFVLPQEQQDALKKVYVMFHILDDCVDEMPDASSQQQALDFWRREINHMYRGQAAHAITKELWPVVQKYKIPEEYFQGLADGCAMDIHKKRYATFSELYDYCYRVAGLVGLTCHKIFGYHSATSEQAAIQLGVAFQLTNILRDISEDLKRDRIYIPQDWLKNCEYAELDLQDEVYNDEFLAVMQKLSETIEEHYQKGILEFANDKDNRLLASKIMAKTYHTIFQNIKKSDFRIFNRGGNGPQKLVLSQWQKYKIATYSILAKWRIV